MKFLILACMLLLATSDYCGGNCIYGDCPGCFGKTEMSFQDVAYWCKQYIWDQTKCRCIVNVESQGNANKITYTSSGYIVGLFHISQVNWASCNGGRAPFHPIESLKCAIDLWNVDQSFSPWWANTNGC